MISPDSFDAWTSMPLEFDDVEPIATPAVKKRALVPGVDIGGFLWKFVAAGSSNTAANILSCLATDKSAQIRKRVAENISTSPDTLELLAKDTDGNVRALVARNHNTPAFILHQLSKDSDVDVRYGVASNPTMPDTLLIRLFLDPDPYVADKASQTLCSK